MTTAWGALDMKRAVTAVSLAVSILGCGPGRQAAWEKESQAKQTAPAPTEAAAAGASDASAGSIAEQALQAWSERVDRKQLEKAITLWEQQLQSEPGNGTVLAHLSRAYYLLGDGYMRNAGEKDAMLPTLEKGTEYGERAMMAISTAFAERVKNKEKVEDAVVSIGKEGIEAIYWYASNLGKFAAEKGFTTQVFYKDRLFAVMSRVLELDPSFFYAAPHRYFGAFYAKAPAFAGGDMDKAKEHFEKALAMEPNYLGTKVLYAEYWAAKQDEKEMFVRLLNEVKSADPSVIPELAAENAIEQKKAEILLSQVDELF